jgi:hypothetical protein
MKFLMVHSCLALIILLGTSCKKTKTDSQAKKQAEAGTGRPPALLMSRDEWPQPFWTAKAKINLKHPKMNVSFNMTMRAEKDQKLWFSAQAFGLLEVARGLITKDSLKVWDKFNNRCMVGSLDKLEDFVPVPMGLSQLQYFLMGRVFWDSLNMGQETKIQDSVMVSGQNAGLGFQAKIWQKFLLHTARAWDAESKTSVSLVNQQFKPSGQVLIPWKKELQASVLNNGQEEKSELQIDFTKFEFTENRPDFTLEVPADCKKETFK